MIFGQSKMISLPQSPNYIPTSIYSGLNGIKDVKWEETFNTITPPTDWTIVDNDGSGTAWDFRQVVAFTSGDTVYPQAAQSFWFSNFNNANSSGLIDEWIISPQLPMVTSGDSIYFYAGAIDAGYDDSLKVWVSTTDINLGSFTQIGYFKVDGPVGSWHRYGFDLSAFAGNQVHIAVNYYIVDGGPSGNYSDNVWVDHFIMSGSGGATVIPISQAIEDLNNDFIPDHLGDTVTVQGVIFSPNYQTSNNSFYISDGTAGTDIFVYGPPVFTWNMGDMLEVTGEVTQYNGMTEIVLLDTSSWSLISTGNPTPEPVVLTLAQYKANAEMYEGSLVGFMSLDLAGGTWPAAGSSANLQLTDGPDTVTFRIDSDTDIDGQPEPTWPVDVIGIGSQFDASVPYDGGYQIFPRYYATDFLPAGSLPVELTSFTAEANLNSVSLNWKTASETNNKGFEIQRNSGSGFATVGFVQGHGTSTQPNSYSFVDQNIAAGQYTYRLKQHDFQGTSSFSSEVSVEVMPVSYSLSQNYPNPFNPTTMINFNLRVDSKVSLKIFNILGQQVSQLISGSMVAGNHQVNFDASKLNSGVYLYRLEATGIDGSSFSAVKKMMLTK